MRARMMHLAVLALCAVARTSASQVPMALGPLAAPTTLPPAVRAAVMANAAQYPFVGLQVFGRDSVLLVFDDSTLTSAALRAHTWMFGPPVTAAEADSCPPEKVLGRRIARAYWKAAGRPAETRTVLVAVRGTQGKDLWTTTTMYYWREQLTAPWAGDPGNRR